MRCENNVCGVLNRPFMRYCRRCRDDATVANWQAGAAVHIWANAARFGRQPLGPAVCEPETVADLSRLPHFAAPRSIIAMRSIQGLLAVHQAAGLLGIFHPFQGGGGIESDEAKPWYAAELVPSPPDSRPFEPRLLDDQKHLVFASSTAVHALHLWSLSGWAYNEPVRYWTVVDASGDQSPRIVAPPVLIDDRRIGLIARGHRGNYQWGVFDLAATQRFAERAVDLPAVAGSPCQVLEVSRQAIAIATPLGHWVWKLADAAANRIDALRRTWRPDASEKRLLLDAEIHDSKDFHLGRQLIRLTRSDEERRHAKFEWFFVKGNSQAHTLCQYSVDFDSLEDPKAHELESPGREGALPIGIHSDGTNPIVLIRGRHLLKFTIAQIADWPGASSIELVDNPSGLIFVDPLLIMLGSGDGEKRSVTIRSLHHPNRHLPIALGDIHADPVVWGCWMFTLEHVGDRLLLRRRAIGVPSCEPIGVGNAGAEI